MKIDQPNVINSYQDARFALKTLDDLPENLSRTIFVLGEGRKLIGSLTDGDIRRGLLNGLEISEKVELFMNKQFKSLTLGRDNVSAIRSFRKSEIKLVPMVDGDGHLIEIVDLSKVKTILPLTALIMAGGRGERLKPYTDNIPKPMLEVGGKPILEHNIDRLVSYGIRTIFISVKYLKNQIIDYFGDGSEKGVKIRYIEEVEALGTLGALSLVNCEEQDLLVMNSDILTNIDFEDFYDFYKDQNCSMALASIPYVVNIPYAVLETDKNEVRLFKEKPSYTYYSNGGIYLLNSSLKSRIPGGQFYNATDLMDELITTGQRLVHYPLLNYWLDIGRHEDYKKAQEDIKHINLS